MLNLKTLKVKELREMAKNQHIKYWYNLKKEELIEALSAGEKEEEKSEMTAMQQIVAKGEDIHRVMKEKMAKKRDTKDYLKTVNPGTIIAFMKENKMLSGKIVEKTNNSSILKVETKFGTSYDVLDKEVEWVKTGKRWPRNIYNAFKASK